MNKYITHLPPLPCYNFSLHKNSYPLLLDFTIFPTRFTCWHIPHQDLSANGCSSRMGFPFIQLALAEWFSVSGTEQAEDEWHWPPLRPSLRCQTYKETAKWGLQGHRKGGHKCSGRVSGQVWAGSYWLHRARSAVCVSKAVVSRPRGQREPFPGVCSAQVGGRRGSRWGGGDGHARSRWLRTDSGSGRARTPLSAPGLPGPGPRPSAGEDGSGCSALCSWPWTWRLSAGGRADATGDSSLGVFAPPSQPLVAHRLQSGGADTCAAVTALSGRLRSGASSPTYPSCSLMEVMEDCANRGD